MNPTKNGTNTKCIIVGKVFRECRAPFVDFEKKWTHCNRYKLFVPAHLSILFLCNSRLPVWHNTYIAMSKFNVDKD
jgi:hypothetical protein